MSNVSLCHSLSPIVPQQEMIAKDDSPVCLESSCNVCVQAEQPSAWLCSGVFMEALLAHLVHHALPLHAVLACKHPHSRKQAAQSPTALNHVEHSVYRQGCSCSA